MAPPPPPPLASAKFLSHQSAFSGSLVSASLSPEMASEVLGRPSKTSSPVVMSGVWDTIVAKASRSLLQNYYSFLILIV